MRNWLFFAVSGYVCSYAGFALLILPSALQYNSPVAAFRDLCGFTALVATAPVLLHATVLSIVFRRQ